MNKNKVIKNLGEFLFLVTVFFIGIVFKSDLKASALIYDETLVTTFPSSGCNNTKDFCYEEKDSLYFYVGYNDIEPNYVYYSFDNSTFKSISKNKQIKSTNSTSDCSAYMSGISKCTNTIEEYLIAYSSLPTKSGGTFTLYLKIDNKVLLSGNKENRFSSTFKFDNKGPTISSVTVSNTGSYVKRGSNLNFDVTLSESFNLKSTTAVTLSFYLGGNSRTTSSCSKKANTTNVLTCSYTVTSSDNSTLGKMGTLNNGTSYITDSYGNYMTNNSFSSLASKIIIDGVSPTYNITAERGTYSTSKNINAYINFSEAITKYSGNGTLGLQIKFSNGNTRACSYTGAVNGDTSTYNYSCSVASTDSGSVSFVALSNGTTYTDKAGNTLSISSAYTSVSGITISNSYKDISNIEVTSNSCTSLSYCDKDDIIKFKFTYSGKINTSSSTFTFNVYANGVSGSGSVYSKSNTEDYYLYEYKVGSNDNGKITMNYIIKLVGLDNNISNSISNTVTSKFVADNANPSISLSKVILNDNVTTDSILYGNNSSTIVYEFNVNETSLINLNSGYIYLVDTNGTKMNVGSSYYITSLNSIIDGNTLRVTVKTNSNSNFKYKLVVEKNAITDSFSRTLNSNYTSSLYEFDSKAPTFDVSIYHDNYTGYNLNEMDYILNNTVTYAISSSDTDVKDFCAVANENDDCSYSNLTLNKKYTYTLSDSNSGLHSFYIKLRDAGKNVSISKVDVYVNKIFTYNKLGEISSNHEITMDLNILSNQDSYKYKWIKSGNSVSFSEAIVASYDGVTVVTKTADFNGSYKLCAYLDSKALTLCSELLNFDSKIDSYNVTIPTGWTNTFLTPTITFSDTNGIKCIVMSKNSSVNCNSTDIIVKYSSKQAISPISATNITVNGTYYFYIEDVAGNHLIKEFNVTNVDNSPIAISVVNGITGLEDLDLNNYKSSHSFKFIFTDELSGSGHEKYSYFFTKNTYTIKSIDSFESYYSSSTYKGTSNSTNINNKYMLIKTPTVEGIYNLYVMAKDKAGNGSFFGVLEIKIDAVAPVITMYDTNGNSTLGGASSYVSSFDYYFIVRDTVSNLQLNNIYYSWIKSGSATVMQETKYTMCVYGEKACQLKQSNIKIPDNLSSSEEYYIKVTATDELGNVGTFSSNSFKFDTTPPTINFLSVNGETVNEDKWYSLKSIVVSFETDKNYNVGTLKTVKYCLNNCFYTDGESYNLNNFTNVVLTSTTSYSGVISLSLKSGINNLYVYSADIFGNYQYKKLTIKTDFNTPVISVNNLTGTNSIAFTTDTEYYIDFTVSDSISGVKSYCIYNSLESSNKTCNSKETYYIEDDGTFIIEAYDNANNYSEYSVYVTGIGSIIFDLSTNIKNGTFTNENVTINLTNIRKSTLNDAASLVGKVEYVAVNSSSFSTSDLEGYFTSASTINNGKKLTITATENKVYVVKVTDSNNNKVSYNYISVSCIDKINPWFNEILSNYVTITTSSTENIQAIDETHYEYANETIVLKFASNSMRDTYNGYNNYLAMKVCLGDAVCDTYKVTTQTSSGYVYNKSSLTVNATYKFSGEIKYYIVDAAGNASTIKSYYVTYINDVDDVGVTIKDRNNTLLNGNNKYNAINLTFSGDTIDDYINDSNIKYLLVKNTINLNKVYLNSGKTIESFTSSGTYKFKNVTARTMSNITLSNVDEEYYLWIYLRDNLSNYKLYKINTLIKLDTIAPEFSEFEYDFVRKSGTQYELIVQGLNEDYSLYLDNNLVTLTDDAFLYSTNLITTELMVEDSAGNSNCVSIDLNLATSGYFARIYRTGNNLEVNYVLYNLGTATVNQFSYLIAPVGYDEEVTIATFNDAPSCISGQETICKSLTYSKKGSIYKVTLSEEAKIYFFVFVNSELIDVVSSDITVDNTSPVISVGEYNSVVTTKEDLTISVHVEETNLTKHHNVRYILTTGSVSNFDSSYNNCSALTNCAKGTTVLDASNNASVVISSNEASELISGNYNLYIYSIDDNDNNSTKKISFVVDNDAPNIEYYIDGYYETIMESMYAQSATKLRFVDSNLLYFEIYNGNTKNVVCYVNSTENDLNCTKNSTGNIGFTKDSSYSYYYLESGSSTRIVAYDSLNNSKEIYVGVDYLSPTFKLYKYIEGEYVEQNGEYRIYNDLASLYIKLEEDNLDYISIDLESTLTGKYIHDAFRYASTSDVGVCMLGNDCDYGASLSEILADNVSTYNKIIITAHDKANREVSLNVNFDNTKPEIWTLNIGETFFVNGYKYEVASSYTIDIQIGENKTLTFDKLMEKFILNVDGYTYSNIKGNDEFIIDIYKDETIFTGNILEAIGEYIVKINYSDAAGNKADEVTVKFVLSDSVAPKFTQLDEFDHLEVGENLNISGIKVTDNYGFTDSTKEKVLYFDDALCNSSVGCSNVVLVSAGVYKFTSAGEYTFTYQMTDLAGNTSSFVQNVTVKDNKGPTITSDSLNSHTLDVGERNADGSVNLPTIRLGYPTAFDNGDDEAKNVILEGIYEQISLDKKIALSEDYYTISMDSSFINIKFKKIGKFTISFMSVDSKSNISEFNYSIEINDRIAPVITNVTNEETIEIELSSYFDFSTVIAKENIEVIDNYDEGINLIYEIETISSIRYKVSLRASDSANNITSYVVYVEMTDRESPVAGTLTIDNPEGTNEVFITITGGSDNSNHFIHEYNVQGGEWIVYEGKGKVAFGKGFVGTANICIRAKDDSSNYSESSCDGIYIDTKEPTITGVKAGIVTDNSVTIDISDENIKSVKVYKDGELLSITKENFPMAFEEQGLYEIVADDTYGNVNEFIFEINFVESVSVANDINTDGEYVTTTIEYDEKYILRANVAYDTYGKQSISIDVNGLEVGSDDLIYILGNIPGIEGNFIISTIDGESIVNYLDSGVIISEDDVYKEGVSNDTFFTKLNGEYYAYAIVKKNEKETENTDVTKSGNKSSMNAGMKIALIIGGVLTLAFGGYQIVRFRRRIRAA